LATDTDRRTDKQMDSLNTLNRLRYRETGLNNICLVISAAL